MHWGTPELVALLAAHVPQAVFAQSTVSMSGLEITAISRWMTSRRNVVGLANAASWYIDPRWAPPGSWALVWTLTVVGLWLLATATASPIRKA